MHKEGHVGVALAVYAPVGLLVVAAGFTDVAIFGAVGTAALAMLPDVDMRLPGVPHRGPTHTVWFALAVGVVLGLGGVLRGLQTGLLAGVGLGAFAAVVGVLTVLSHLLADALTPMGIAPFEPVRPTHYSVELTRAANPVANYALLGLGLLLAGGAAAIGVRIAALG